MVDYDAVTAFKKSILRSAYENCKHNLPEDSGFQKFCSENASWIEDYALFVSLKAAFDGVVWNKWPDELRDRREDALREWKEKLSDTILMEKFFQFLFYRQWASLKKYCNSRNIQIIGDIPIYVNYDSADVWANPNLFKLDHEKKPVFVAGVPPDYFSSTGQLWGNPVYNWDALRSTQYAWWIKRFEHNLKLFNVFRVDHFRGFVAFWEVSSFEKTALNGKWAGAPAEDFFRNVFRHFPDLPLIAEDLGVITPDVKEIISLFDLPGMKVLLFAFGHNLPVHPYAPHTYVRNCVAYTGTHDNNTIRGWFREEASADDKRRLFEYIGREISEEEIHWEMIRLVMMSVANMVIIPMQDFLGLGSEKRMNYPSTPFGNWKWRLLPEDLTPDLRDKILRMTRIYGRI
jgi:4-alpha-glucanotransferase